MSEHVVQVPSRLTLAESLEFAHALRSLPLADRYVFDFRRVGRVEPFGMLFLSSEIHCARKRASDVEFAATNFESCTYAAHMGFFRAFGLDYGKAPGEAKGSGTYLPISIFDVETLQRDANARFEAVGNVVEREAQKIASVLTRQDTGDLHDTLTYSIREIFRNVVEHSGSPQFGFCAQYWPSYAKVQLAILDRGVGLRVGLSGNPHLLIQSDQEALNLCLMPGVSGKAVTV